MMGLGDLMLYMKVYTRQFCKSAANDSDFNCPCVGAHALQYLYPAHLQAEFVMVRRLRRLSWTGLRLGLSCYHKRWLRLADSE